MSNQRNRTSNRIERTSWRKVFAGLAVPAFAIELKRILNLKTDSSAARGPRNTTWFKVKRWS